MIVRCMSEKSVNIREVSLSCSQYILPCTFFPRLCIISLYFFFLFLLPILSTFKHFKCNAGKCKINNFTRVYKVSFKLFLFYIQILLIMWYDNTKPFHLWGLCLLSISSSPPKEGWRKRSKVIFNSFLFLIQPEWVDILT